MKNILAVLFMVGLNVVMTAQSGEMDTKHALHIATGYSIFDYRGDYGAFFLSVTYERTILPYLSAQLDLTVENGLRDLDSRGTWVTLSPFQSVGANAGVNGVVDVLRGHTLSGGPFIGATSLGIGEPFRNPDGSFTSTVSSGLTFQYGFRATYRFPLGKTTKLGFAYTFQRISFGIEKPNTHRFGVLFVKQL